MVPVPVPVPTFEKLWFRFRFRFLLLQVPAPYLDHKKQIKKKKSLEFFFDFFLSKLFNKEKVHKFQQICGKM